MYQPYGNVLEESVLAASPMELTGMLFDRLILELRNARASLRSGDIAGRSLSASKVVEIALELSNSLDCERGGDLSRNLRQLYAYIVDQVNEGNARQDERCFATAEAVAVPIAEAWHQIAGTCGGEAQDSGGVPCWDRDGELAAVSLSFCG